MANYKPLILILITFYICQYLGRYSESLILFAILSIFAIKISSLRSLSVIGFTLTLSLTSITTQSENDICIIILPLIIFITRFALDINFLQGNWYIFVISFLLSLFSSTLSDRDIICLFISIASYYLPLNFFIFNKKDFLYFKRDFIFVLLLCFIIPFLIIYKKSPLNVNKIAIITGSSWSKFDKKFDEVKLDQLDISYMYSYSELVTLLNADIINLDDVSSLTNVQELWMITPTMTFKEKESEALINWVKNGGKLILITDHTDLFGHATVLNSFLYKVGLKTITDAFFPIFESETAQTSLSYNYQLKTANTQSGFGLWPFMTARWVSEEVDYSNRNFFGPMRATGTSKYGRKTIAGNYSYGNGQIILFGDSTIFANFAIYQPGYIDFVEYLRSTKLTPIIYKYIILSYLIVLIFGIIFNYRRILYLFPIIGFWTLADIRISPLNWPESIICSGMPEYISEISSPDKSFSTGYSLIPLTGKKPRWKDNPKNNEFGLWFSDYPPPHDQWIWINCKIDNNENKKEDYLYKLLNNLTSINPNVDYPIFEKNVINAGNLWTNECMGEWWLDHGISVSKRKRFSKWLQAITSNKFPYRDETCSVVELGNNNKIYKLKYTDEEWLTISLPEILYHGKSEIYLGRGISAKVVMLNSKEVLIGTRSLSEGWKVPSSWVLIPQD